MTPEQKSQMDTLRREIQQYIRGLMLRYPAGAIKEVFREIQGFGLRHEREITYLETLGRKEGGVSYTEHDE